MSWLAEVPSLDTLDLRDVQRISHELLDHLAGDRKLLTRLVDEIPDDADLMANSRVTLLLHRLALYQAPERGFEIRMNMNPRPGNQRVPHDHCHAFATRVLTGGYVHVVRRRTDGWEGPFTGDDLELSIVTFERPGDSYTLGHPMVHQAAMEPGTVTLVVRGPRRKSRSNAVAELMPPRDTWPGPAVPGRQAVASRPASVGEYRLMRTYLLRRGLID
ncbi:hypothetical protein AB0I66_34630 [Streptomyces sp. NPDC050439]|uniref:hypothetical protein n=1 Tax=unclassified Streptomyces TaxID=2593676 RepID=UPI0034126746